MIFKNSAARSSSSTVLIISPFANINPFPSPPARPKSASLASPGPFTAQPITATVIPFFPEDESLDSIGDSFSSISSARPLRSIFVLPHVGQDIRLIQSLIM